MRRLSFSTPHVVFGRLLRLWFLTVVVVDVIVLELVVALLLNVVVKVEVMLLEEHIVVRVDEVVILKPEYAFDKVKEIFNCTENFKIQTL
jgi:hypothetical protein